MYRYTPRGVCSRAIDIDLDGDKVARVEFVGGCDGNLKAVSRLIEGMTVEDVAAAEAALDVEGLVAEALEGIERIWIDIEG